MPLKASLKFWSALSDQDEMITEGPFQPKLSILFYSMLCYAETTVGILNICGILQLDTTSKNCKFFSLH